MNAIPAIHSSSRLRCLVLVMTCLGCGRSTVETETAQAPAAPDAIGLSELVRLDLLPRGGEQVAEALLAESPKDRGADKAAVADDVDGGVRSYGMHLLSEV